MHEIIELLSASTTPQGGASAATPWAQGFAPGLAPQRASWLASGLALAALPVCAQACVECRERVLDTVFGGGFLSTFAVLLVPVALLVALALLIGTRR